MAAPSKNLSAIARRNRITGERLERDEVARQAQRKQAAEQAAAAQKRKSEAQQSFAEKLLHRRLGEKHVTDELIYRRGEHRLTNARLRAEAEGKPFDPYLEIGHFLADLDLGARPTKPRKGDANPPVEQLPPPAPEAHRSVMHQHDPRTIEARRIADARGARLREDVQRENEYLARRRRELGLYDPALGQPDYGINGVPVPTKRR